MTWLTEKPEPILAQTMPTEAAVARRDAADEAHPLTCRCHECADYDLILDPLYPDFGPEDEQ